MKDRTNQIPQDNKIHISQDNNQILLHLEDLNKQQKKNLLKLLIRTRSNPLNIKWNYLSTFTFILSTILLILSGIVPFLDNILLHYYPKMDTIPIPHFVYYSSFIWAASMSLSTLLVILGTFCKADKLLYIFPISAHVIMFGAAILNYKGVHITGLWQFRAGGVAIGLCFLISFIQLRKIFKYIFLADNVKKELIDLIIKDEEVEAV